MAETTFKRNPAAEAAAIAAGIATKEEIEARGGINASGYYGDSYREGITLTDEEYANAIKSALAQGKSGADVGKSINTASQTKLTEYYRSQGYTPEQISGLVSGSLRVTQGGRLIPVAGATSEMRGTEGVSNEKIEAGKSAYSLLLSEFERYGLGALVTDLKGFIEEGLSPAEFTIKLRATPAYQKRFAANAQRIGKGLRALSEAEYIELEDQYQNVMRNYGLPASYYTRGDMGRQEGFEKFIAGDVSAAELEDRIQTAQNRVINAAPQVGQALRQFYPDITNGDILAYALDPEQALSGIKRKVQAAEIGAGAIQAGLATGLSRAEELARYGVTGEQARQGFQAVASVLPRAGMLSEIYSKQGAGPYTQTTAEQEVFGLAGAAESERQRRKLTELEQAQFAGSSGMAGGALARERAGSF